MSSSCLSSGGGRAYRIEALDLDIIKSPSSTSWISSPSPSPSSTLSESSNCPLAISTRKPRTPRKRPNQTYNEAAAILSTAYPKIFPWKFTHSHSHDHNSVANNNTSLSLSSSSSSFLFEPSELLMPFHQVDSSGFLLESRPDFPIEIKRLLNPCRSPGEINNSGDDDCFDAESILDEEMGEGIESIMGNLEMENNDDANKTTNTNTFCYGYPVGFGMIRESSRAMRKVDHCDWWSFPSVNVIDVNPSLARFSTDQNKKKTKFENSEAQTPNAGQGLLLKLNYDTILHDWSDKASPFSADSPAAESAGNDVRARLAQIDLFWDNGGVREASVLRYKEKRRTRLFSKKIRYEVRKVNADRRPRMKGRFVRTPNSSDD
ncbi:hypothetical protein C2S53_014427 [Perilla frutescens var. hirtella]|uniref:CCT domain-containing protein n=1 Tax=Perilla frutescens var. hirtella TaxID=608512 RepID=A0AAD4J437_PERFH|nr:hypothetical protein C2S53_014427 [Perilla frutescens var. hirtella]